MEKKILGIDLNDQRAILSFYSEEKIWTFPAAVCIDRDAFSWSTGSDAYERVLSGQGIITDKLYSFIQKGKITTLYGREYDSVELLGKYLNCIITDVCGEDYKGSVSRIVVCIPTIDVDTVDRLFKCICSLGISKDSISIISRSEAFIYYTMCQSPDIRNNNVGMFSLEDNELTYYEFKVQKKAKNTLVYADKELLDESFNLDITKSESGAKLADKILLSCAERLFRNKIFSSVFVTGTGFESVDWAPEFMKYVCNRRKVFADSELFSRGAGVRGADLESDKPLFTFTPICDGRTDSSVYININRKDRTLAYPIINIGDPWYSVDRTLNIIPYSVDHLDLSIVPMDERKRKTVNIGLDFLPERPDRTSKLSLRIHFTNARHMTVDIHDLGFGELFPASGNSISREVALWE